MGHVLVFPGKLRHHEQKIMIGLQFLLVEFLVDKNGDDGDAAADGNSKNSNSSKTGGCMSIVGKE
eukprot:13287580-Ditylum_brightwellii.AAC.1